MGSQILFSHESFTELEQKGIWTAVHPQSIRSQITAFRSKSAAEVQHENSDFYTVERNVL